MVKRILLSVLIALVMVFAIAGTALAADPTHVNITWDGGGAVDGIVTTGATTTTFNVNAAGSSGVFTATDSNDNPYGYGTDTNDAYIDGTLTNGQIEFQTVRNTSYVPMYGVAGQTVYAFVGSNGTGAMATGSWTNYAEMTNCTYSKPKTPNGYNFEAEGSSYQIVNEVTALNGTAWLNSIGSGSSKINDMTTGAYGANGVNMGWGGGCYTNANAVFTGAGSFGTYATAQNSLTTPIADASGNMVSGGWSASGSSSLSTIMTFTNGGAVGNYSIKVR